MLIESVTSVAFGPFRDATLEFAPQLTVVYGPNEAGKSSWHAAIYASLCGMRRARGQMAKDRDFAELRRPWRGDAWEVRAIVRLDSGRRVELRQNLSDLAHCSATDADLGRDVSGEILNEGTPDAAKWLGLDRQSFLSVACVRQAEVQSVADDATSLQDELQRAAASATRDATAAEAIARMEDFQRDQVGQDRANSTRPLRAAKTRLTAAEDALANARKEHADWLALEAEALGLRRKAEEEDRKGRMLHAMRARREAEALRSRLDRARTLAQAYPHGQPALLAEDDALAEEVTSALGLWRSRPEVPVLNGESSAAIRAEIERLPQVPLGDQRPQPVVMNAMKAYEHALQALEFDEARRPPAIRATDGGGLTADQLRELANTLDATAPPLDAGLEATYGEAQVRLRAIERSSFFRRVLAGLALAGVFGGAGVWALWNPWIGAALVLSCAIAFVLLVYRSGYMRRARAVEDLVKAQAQLLSQRKAVEDANEKVKAARVHISGLGLPADGTALRKLADALIWAERQRQEEMDWSTVHQKLLSEVADTGGALSQALRSAGIVETTDLAAAFEEYDRECRSRAEQAARAEKREFLDQRLLHRDATEKAVEEAQMRRSTADQKLMAALARCGLKAPNAEAASEKLSIWQAERKAKLIKFDAAIREYAELNALLDGGTLENLETRTSDHERRATELAAEFGPLPEAVLGADLAQELRDAEAVARNTADAATRAETLAQERARQVPNVPEAEEALASAQQELERVTRLSRTLALTLDFLRRAEDRVHRDIAPLLAAGLRRWLSDVTQRRYTDARVDPRNLSVQVLGPDNEWREARHLSHGTAEQIYLLLRVVLAERLATTGEKCPLILDDVLVQSDAVRKGALLDLIVSVSRERQVIVLTQEEEVLRWAQANVIAPNRVVVLPAPNLSADAPNRP